MSIAFTPASKSIEALVKRILWLERYVIPSSPQYFFKRRLNVSVVSGRPSCMNTSFPFGLSSFIFLRILIPASGSSSVRIHTLEEINKKMGKTILLVTHDPIIASSCDRIIFLKDGKVKEDLKRTGDKEQFYNEIITNWC